MVLMYKDNLITEAEMDQLKQYWAHRLRIGKHKRQKLMFDDNPEFILGFQKRIVDWCDAVFGVPFLVHTERAWSYDQLAYFEKHDDCNFPNRVWTAVTLVNASEDLAGGELVVYDEQDRLHDTKLQVGETVFFPSHMKHEVLTVTNGHRETYGICLGYADYSGPDMKTKLK